MLKELGLVVTGVTIGVVGTLYVTKDFLIEGFAHKVSEAIDEEVQDMKDELYNEQVEKDNKRDYTKPLRKSGKYPWGEGGIKVATNRIMLDRESAKKVLDALEDHIDLYGFVSLADYNDFTDVSSDSEDALYGWIDLSGAVVVPKHEGFTIKLPVAKRLNK